MGHKKAVVISLIDSAKNLCSEENLYEELENVKICLNNNKYPKFFLSKIQIAVPVNLKTCNLNMPRRTLVSPFTEISILF